MLRDYSRFAINGIKNRKLRSWLTMIGIIIKGSNKLSVWGYWN